MPTSNRKVVPFSGSSLSTSSPETAPDDAGAPNATVQPHLENISDFWRHILVQPDIGTGRWQGGGGGGGDALNSRVAKLESDVEHIKSDVSEIKTSIARIQEHQREDFRLLCSIIIAATIGLAGLMAKGFNWI